MCVYIYIYVYDVCIYDVCIYDVCRAKHILRDSACVC